MNQTKALFSSNVFKEGGGGEEGFLNNGLINKDVNPCSKRSKKSSSRTTADTHCICISASICITCLYNCASDIN